MPQLVMWRCCSLLSVPSPPTVQLPDRVQSLFYVQMLLSCTFSPSMTTCGILGTEVVECFADMITVTVQLRDYCMKTLKLELVSFSRSTEMSRGKNPVTVAVAGRQYPSNCLFSVCMKRFDRLLQELVAQEWQWKCSQNVPTLNRLVWWQWVLTIAMVYSICAQ